MFSDHYLSERLTRADAEMLSAVRGALVELGYSNEALPALEGFDVFKLSNGQKRRVALALAYLEHKPIYFFDEWAADQDPEARHHFYSYVLPKLKAAGAAIVAVSHDERYFGVADRMLRMRRGRSDDSERERFERAAQPSAIGL